MTDDTIEGVTINNADKKNPFKLVDLAPRIEEKRQLTPNEKTIRVLEWCLEKARKGEIQVIAIAGVDQDEGIVTSWCADMHESSLVHSLSAAIAHLEFRYHDEVYEKTRTERNDIY